MSRMIALVVALLISSVWCESSNAQQAPTAGAQRPTGGLAGAVARAGAADVKTSPAEEEIEAALAKPVKFQFDTVPLVEVIDFFADQFDINIQLDPKGLTDAAVDSQAAVTKAVRKPIPLESALRLILDEFDLTITIQNNVLLVTSKEKADEVLETRVYWVGDLIGRLPNFGPLMNLITSTVQPDSWGDGGSLQPHGIKESLVVAQKRDVHVEIRALLAELRAAASAKQGGTADDSKATPRLSTEVHHLWGASGEQTAQALKRLVEPTTWEGAGGDGMISVINITRGGPQTTSWDVLLVRQTEDIHNQLDDILLAFRSTGLGGGMGMGGMGGGLGAGTGVSGGISGGTAPASAPASPPAPGK